MRVYDQDRPVTGDRPFVDDVAPGGTGPFALSRGKHPDPGAGTCLMEATALLAGEPHSDRPACVHPVLAAVARVVNDAVADDVRAALFPLAGRLIGTAAASPPGTTERLVAFCCRRALAVTPTIWALRLRRDLRRIDAGHTFGTRRAVGTASYATSMIALVSPAGRDHLLVALLTDAIDLVVRGPVVGMLPAEDPAEPPVQVSAQVTAPAGAGRTRQLSLTG